MANVRSCLNSKGSDLSRWNGKILILEASKESRRIGNHTNFVYEFLDDLRVFEAALIAASGDYY